MFSIAVTCHKYQYFLEGATKLKTVRVECDLNINSTKKERRPIFTSAGIRFCLKRGMHLCHTISWNFIQPTYLHRWIDLIQAAMRFLNALNYTLGYFERLVRKSDKSWDSSNSRSKHPNVKWVRYARVYLCNMYIHFISTISRRFLKQFTNTVKS